MGTQSDSLRRQIIHFLTTDKVIDQINFVFLGRYRISTHGYRHDVAGAMFNGVMLGTDVAKGAVASYRPETDSLELDRKFSFSNPIDRGLLLHECTHLQLDLQKIGTHSRFEEEAVAYTAQAIYGVVCGDPISYEKSAPAIHAGMYAVANGLLQNARDAAHPAARAKLAADERALVQAVASNPHYRAGPSDTVDSNRMQRGAWSNCLRNHAWLYGGPHWPR